MALEQKLSQLAAKKKSPVIESEVINVDVPYSYTPPSKPEVPAMNKQVDPQTVDDIKTVYSPKSQQQDITVSEQTYTPTYDIVDPTKVREQAQKLNSGISKTDLLLGLIPLATSALAGGAGEGVDVSSKYYMGLATDDKKRTQSLEDKLMEINKARAIASAKSKESPKRFQSVNIVDNETKDVIKANFDTSTGQYYSPEGKILNSDKIRAGYSVIPEEFNRRSEVALETGKKKVDYTPRINPETGLISRIENNQLAPIGTQVAKLNPKQEKDLTQLTDKFITTDAYKKPAGTLAVVSTINELLQQANSGNASAANFARKELAKMAEGASRLSDQDVEMVGGSPALKEKAKRFANLQKTRIPLTPRDIEELRQVAKLLEKNARLKLGSAVQSLDKTYVSEYGGVSGSVINKMRSYVPNSPVQKMESKSSPKTVQRVGSDGKIYTYTLNPKTGKYE